MHGSGMHARTTRSDFSDPSFCFFGAMTTITAKIWYRPVRIGWCVEDGDFEGLRRALALTHTLWGGRFNPVLPVWEGDLGRARDLIAAFEVDYLFAVSEGPGVNKLVAEQPSLVWHPRTRPRLVMKRGDSRAPQFLDVEHAVSSITAGLPKHPDRLHPEAVAWSPEPGDPLSDVLAATHGVYPPESVVSFDYRKLLRDDLGASFTILQEVFPFPFHTGELRTPNSLTAVGLQRDIPSGYWDRRGFFLGSASSFPDLVNYWNLRATGLELFFYDPDHALRLSTGYKRMLYDWRELSRSGAHPSRLVVWTTRPDVELPDGVDDVPLVHRVIHPESWSGGGLEVPEMRWRPYTRSGIAADVGASESTTLRLEHKPFDEDAARGQRLAVRVEISPGRGTGELVYRLPNIPALAPVLSAQLFLQETIRIGRHGTAYVVDAAADAVELRGWDAGLVVRSIFQLAGITTKPSSAGKTATRLIAQLGGLEACEVFKLPGVRALLNEISASRDFTREHAVGIIGKAGPITSSLWKVPCSGETPMPGEVFDYLAELGIFQVGLSFDCPNCGLGFWLSLDQTATKSICVYCGKSFYVGRQLGSRPWRYRRAGLFGADNNLEGAVPVSLVLNQLYATSQVWEEYLWITYTTGMDLEGIGTASGKCETDLVVVAQTPAGRVQVLIGECKARSRIEAADVDNLLVVAQALVGVGVEPFVLFSKLTDLTPEELGHIRLIEQAHGVEPIILTDRELEPDFIYERTHQQFDLLYSGIDFSGLAEATRDAFLSPRPLSETEGDAAEAVPPGA